MKPTILLFGFASFLACLALHVAVWRVARPRSDIRALFLIFLAVPGAAAILVPAAAAVIPDAPLPDTVELAAMLLLHCALSCAYIQTYPAVQAQSPSLEIVRAVVESMPRGLSREDILAVASTATLVQARVDDLLANGLIRVDRDRYVLTPTSVKLVRFFLALAALIGLEGKGG